MDTTSQREGAERPAGLLERMCLASPCLSIHRLLLTNYPQVPATQTMFPAIFKMAVDYIPTQAIAIQCARAFPQVLEMETPHRGVMSNDLFECTQVLKYSLGTRDLSFTSHLVNMGVAQDALEKQAQDGVGLGRSETFTMEELQELF